MVCVASCRRSRPRSRRGRGSASVRGVVGSRMMSWVVAPAAGPAATRAREDEGRESRRRGLPRRLRVIDSFLSVVERIRIGCGPRGCGTGDLAREPNRGLGPSRPGGQVGSKPRAKGHARIRGARGPRPRPGELRPATRRCSCAGPTSRAWSRSASSSRVFDRCPWRNWSASPAEVACSFSAMWPSRRAAAPVAAVVLELGRAERRARLVALAGRRPPPRTGARAAPLRWGDDVCCARRASSESMPLRLWTRRRRRSSSPLGFVPAPGRGSAHSGVLAVGAERAESTGGCGVPMR